MLCIVRTTRLCRSLRFSLVGEILRIVCPVRQLLWKKVVNFLWEYTFLITRNGRNGYESWLSPFLMSFLSTIVSLCNGDRSEFRESNTVFTMTLTFNTSELFTTHFNFCFLKINLEKIRSIFLFAPQFPLRNYTPCLAKWSWKFEFLCKPSASYPGNNNLTCRTLLRDFPDITAFRTRFILVTNCHSSRPTVRLLAWLDSQSMHVEVCWVVVLWHLVTASVYKFKFMYRILKLRWR